MPLQQSPENTLFSLLCYSPQPSDSLSMKLVLLGFSCLDLMETTALVTPLGFPRLIRSRPPPVFISGSCGFCLQSEFWVYPPLLESFFFFFFWSVLFHPCNSTSLYLQYICVCMCVCLHDHVKPQPIDVSLSFLLSQRSTQLLQHPTVCIHFKGRRD